MGSPVRAFFCCCLASFRTFPPPPRWSEIITNLFMPGSTHILFDHLEQLRYNYSVFEQIIDCVSANSLEKSCTDLSSFSSLPHFLTLFTTIIVP